MVTRLDHAANITPWVLAAQDRGVHVRRVDFDVEDGTLKLDDFAAALEARPRLVAVGYASNALGTINPVKKLVQMAHEAGAQVYVDAVQYAAHGPIDVDDLGCDFLVSSAYKYFGPHVRAVKSESGWFIPIGTNEEHFCNAKSFADADVKLSLIGIMIDDFPFVNCYVLFGILLAFTFWECEPLGLFVGKRVAGECRRSDRSNFLNHGQSFLCSEGLNQGLDFFYDFKNICGHIRSFRRHLTTTPQGSDLWQA